LRIESPQVSSLWRGFTGCLASCQFQFDFSSQVFFGVMIDLIQPLFIRLF